jgi:hypothetical protein
MSGAPIADAMERAARLYGAGELDAALALCSDILHADPTHFYALHLTAAIAAQQGRHEDCVRLATRALQSNPRNADVLSNRGAALRALSRYDEALADYDRALALAPRSAATLNNRGVTLAALGRHREAVDCYDAALAVEPQYARARYNRGLSRLMLGDFQRGWLDYEWRWPGGEKPTTPRPFKVPELRAEDLGRGGPVALWTEQGLGDGLVFSTLVPELAARSHPFILEADRRLVPALRRAHPDWQVVPKEESEAAFARCDRHLALGSLGGIFRNARESFARQPLALLAADPERICGYRARVAAAGARPVGISWRTFQSAERAYYARTRSMPLAAFMTLSQVPDVRLVDLQYGDTAAERAAFAEDGGRLDRIEELDRFNDLEGLLALIEACDAVVTTDNATAHLAGALGKRTFLMFLEDRPTMHYWAPNERRRSHWYPSVEIVGAPMLDTWARVMDRVRELLAAP